MNHVVDMQEVSATIDLGGGDRIILLDRAGMRDKYSREQRSRNIFRVDGNASVVWQVESKFDDTGGPFTGLKNTDDGLVAYRWDGSNYHIDPATGYAVPASFEK